MQEDRQMNRIFIYKKDKMMIQSGRRGNLMLVCSHNMLPEQRCVLNITKVILTLRLRLAAVMKC